MVFGVEPICRVLSEHGMPIAPCTYCEARNRAPSRRAVREEQLRGEVARVHATNYGVYGGAQGLAAAQPGGHPDRALRGASPDARARPVRCASGQEERTTIADPQALRAGDLVNRKFNPRAPNVLWVADFTYVSTWTGWVYVAFVIDAYSRRIVGWRTATSVNTQLFLDAIEHAIWTRSREGITDLTGLIDHHDRGSQGGFNWPSQHLDREVERWVWCEASAGSCVSRADPVAGGADGGLARGSGQVLGGDRSWR